MLQRFEWNVPADQKHFLRLKNVLQDSKNIGIDKVWLPPACKGQGGAQANGYDVYDLYDVGEFKQKGSKSTKWGLREDLEQLSNRGARSWYWSVLRRRTKSQSWSRQQREVQTYRGGLV